MYKSLAPARASRRRPSDPRMGWVHSLISEKRIPSDLGRVRSLIISSCVLPVVTICRIAAATNRKYLVLIEHGIDNNKPGRFGPGNPQIPVLDFFKNLAPLEMLAPAFCGEACERIIDRIYKEDRLIRNDLRPSVVHRPQPAFGVGDHTGERDRLVGKPAVRIPVGDHQFSFCKRRAHHRCEVSGVIGDKEA